MTKDLKLKYVSASLVMASVLTMTVPVYAEPQSECCGECYDTAVPSNVSWMRAGKKGMTTAAYFIGGSGVENDCLIRVQSDYADIIELHDHINDNGIMRMRPIVNVPVVDGKADMKPGGKHIMLIGLKKDLSVGDVVTLRLIFEKSGVRDVTFDVK